jgi:hypothetical protein
MSSKPVRHYDTLTVTTHRLPDFVVLTLTGRLDTGNPFLAGQSVERALGHVDACLAHRPRGIVVDLLSAEPTRFVVSLLGLVRRRAERLAVPLVLAAPAACQQLLEEVQVASLYAVYPSVSLALDAVPPPREVVGTL